MALRVYNTYSNRIEEFVPLVPGEVRMYNCGPTVYDSPHVGNFRTFAFADTLRRYLEYRGYRVTQVMNITDVGHLTRDAVEAGEDKMEEGLRRLRAQGLEVSDPYQVAEYFTREFFEVRRQLGFVEAHVYPRATQHVPEMIAMIETLLQKGYAYRADGNVYFDVSRFEPYGRLSGNTVEQMKAGARIEVNPEKRNPVDFALWKHDPKHLMQFDSPWGRGFPGWHIECSAMSRKYLGDTFDIHTGGEDNIFPHHECEIAQSEGATGKPLARYWMHARHLLWEGRKMSKSEGTFFTIRNLLEQGYPPLAIRYALVSTHYRMQVNYSLRSFADARQNVQRLADFHRRLLREAEGAGDGTDSGEVSVIVAGTLEAFTRAMDDDLNTSAALGAVHDFVTEVNRALDRGTVPPAGAREALATLTGFDAVLGFLPREAEVVPADVQKLVETRAAARVARNWPESDRLREEIRRLGWMVEDGRTGQTLKRA